MPTRPPDEFMGWQYDAYRSESCSSIDQFFGVQNDQPLVTPPPRPRFCAWR